MSYAETMELMWEGGRGRGRRRGKVSGEIRGRWVKEEAWEVMLDLRIRDVFVGVLSIEDMYGQILTCIYLR